MIATKSAILSALLYMPGAYLRCTGCAASAARFWSPALDAPLFSTRLRLFVKDGRKLIIFTSDSVVSSVRSREAGCFARSAIQMPRPATRIRCNYCIDDWSLSPFYARAVCSQAVYAAGVNAIYVVLLRNQLIALVLQRTSANSALSHVFPIVARSGNGCPTSTPVSKNIDLLRNCCLKATCRPRFCAKDITIQPVFNLSIQSCGDFYVVKFHFKSLRKKHFTADCARCHDLMCSKFTFYAGPYVIPSQLETILLALLPHCQPQGRAYRSGSRCLRGENTLTAAPRTNFATFPIMCSDSCASLLVAN